MVDQILDIVEEAVAARQASKRHGLLGSAVVGGHVTDFLDVRTIIESAAAEWLDPDHAGKGASVLVAEPSSFLRGLLRGELEMAGHRVTEAATQDEAMDRLEHREIRVVLADMDLPPLGCGSLKKPCASSRTWRGFPWWRWPVRRNRFANGRRAWRTAR
jgi:two-component system chemotaxis sensor kinase CheA